MILVCLSYAGLILAGCAMGPLQPPDSSRAQRVVETAQSLQGRPYQYGGRTPQGFDCSGFVQYVFKTALGMSLPRTSQAQFHFARPVPRGCEQPSDLLFFNIDGRGISHVGIYLGRGRFIHAPRGGSGVKISQANERYWRNRLIGVRRIL